MLSDLLGADAAPLEFAHGGKTYKVSPVTQQIKSAVERYLRAKAYADLYALREEMPADQYADALASLQRDRASYQYLGAVFWTELATRGLTALLTKLLFDAGEREADRLLEERGEDVGALVQEQIVASMPRAQAEKVRQRMRQQREARGGGNPPAPA